MLINFRRFYGVWGCKLKKGSGLRVQGSEVK
jgi:hypothetical protein